MNNVTIQMTEYVHKSTKINGDQRKERKTDVLL